MDDAKLTRTSPPLADHPSTADKIERALGKTTDLDGTVYRARAVVMAGGDVAREAKRLDEFAAGRTLTDHQADHLYTARAACALVLGQSPKPFLVKVTHTDRNTPIARTFHLMAAVAAHRADPTARTRAALTDQLARAEVLIANVSDTTDPDYSGYAVTHLLELHWWQAYVRAALEAE